jgi:asparagine synthase (glutamine-hydrolysing)
MCGIFGFYLKNSIDDNKIEKAKKALKLIKHRGPDSSNWYYNKSKGIFLGHTRLSIIDQSTLNNQPLIRDNKALIYNGEIYNKKTYFTKFYLI